MLLKTNQKLKGPSLRGGCVFVDTVQKQRAKQLEQTKHPTNISDPDSANTDALGLMSLSVLLQAARHPASLFGDYQPVREKPWSTWSGKDPIDLAPEVGSVAVKIVSLRVTCKIQGFKKNNNNRFFRSRRPG